MCECWTIALSRHGTHLYHNDNCFTVNSIQMKRKYLSLSYIQYWIRSFCHLNIDEDDCPSQNIANTNIATTKPVCMPDAFARYVFVCNVLTRHEKKRLCSYRII